MDFRFGRDTRSQRFTRRFKLLMCWVPIAIVSFFLLFITVRAIVIRSYKPKAEMVWHVADRTYTNEPTGGLSLWTINKRQINGAKFDGHVFYSTKMIIQDKEVKFFDIYSDFTSKTQDLIWEVDVDKAPICHGKGFNERDAIIDSQLKQGHYAGNLYIKLTEDSEHQKEGDLLTVYVDVMVLN